MLADDGKTRVSVRIMGETYPIKGSASAEHIEGLASLVDSRMRQVAEHNPKLGQGKVAVLTALMLAEELLRLQEQLDRLAAVLDAEWEDRHRKMDKA
ncbi:MAG: cell division protein ZapA [Bacillota bacterium]